MLSPANSKVIYQVVTMLFHALYQLGIGLLCPLALPKIFYSYWRHGKYRNSLGQRLGFGLPPFKKTHPCIWVHAISVGETRAVAPLVQQLKREHPDTHIIVSSVTETGHAEAKRCLSLADHHVYMPIDLKFVQRRVLRSFQPDLVVICETDFWFNFLSEAKSQGAQIVLVNGKISERSTRRFSALPFVARALMQPIDLFCVQSGEYSRRFQSLGVSMEKLYVSGNLKFDSSDDVQPASTEFRERLGLQKGDLVLTLGSTHAPEEVELLDTLSPLWDTFSNLKVIVVPRHPERFPAVAELLSKWPQLNPVCYSQGSARPENRLILLDAMGLLRDSYSVSDLAVVAGSFSSAVGGHNILEPLQFGVPVIYGPQMHQQAELEDLVRQSGAGRKVELKNLEEQINLLLSDAKTRTELSAKGFELMGKLQGSTGETWKEIQKQCFPLASKRRSPLY